MTRIALSTCFAFFTVLLMSVQARASVDTIGPNGINAAPLHAQGLKGAGVLVGMVDELRPGILGISGDSAPFRNDLVGPAAVYLRNGPVNVNSFIDNHAEAVAGVMISDAVGMDPSTTTGVAPDALLHASASNHLAGDIAPQDAVILATNHIATVQSGNVRIIDISILGPDSGIHDGNSQYTLFVDWSADAHNVLYVTSGRNSNMAPAAYIPSDNFNGITVGASEKVGGVYRKFSAVNDATYDVEGARTAWDILAPGASVDVTLLGNTQGPASGTSFAAPHVAGTAALLHQYADQRVPSPGWDGSAFDHKVMKAVILNSADKIKDDGTLAPIGSFLGMERTVLKSNNDTWLNSDAYAGIDAELIPFDEELGAGHLNARRALQQFAAGEHNAGIVPPIGWHNGMTAFEDDINKYAIGTPLLGGSFISITLAWDRHVNFAFDAGNLNQWDLGDEFEEYLDTLPHADDVINDLDIYLLPSGSTDLSDAIAASTSSDSTIDHIFFEIPATGEYEFWVHQWDDEATGGGEEYAIAWWAAAAIGTAQGDYNGDGDVTIADYATWKSDYGEIVTPDTGSDGNGDGRVDAGDYVRWRNQLAMIGSGSGGLASVPEPNVAMIIASGLVVILARVRRPA